MQEDVVDAELVDTPKQSRESLALASAREKLSRLVGRSVQVMEELMDYGENERVRLAAAEAIADRAGLSRQVTATLQVNTGEHEAARIEAEELVKGIERNKAALNTHVVTPSVESLIIHEGDVVEA